MRHIQVPARAGVVAPLRIALIAGAYQEPADFEQAGFADAVKARDLAIDLAFIAPELQHLLDRTVLDAMRTDIIAAARDAGCAQIWLGGISLGGFIALAFAEQRPGEVDGLCLLAPYLGNRMVTSEIGHAGGLSRWRPPALADDDEERRLWLFIRRLRTAGPLVHLGVGRHDRFSHGHQLFADALPDASVDVIDGGHDWPVWLQLWERFLDRISSRGMHAR